MNTRLYLLKFTSVPIVVTYFTILDSLHQAFCGLAMKAGERRDTLIINHGYQCAILSNCTKHAGPGFHSCCLSNKRIPGVVRSCNKILTSKAMPTLSKIGVIGVLQSCAHSLMPYTPGEG